ncbi:NAD(P)-binding protein [Xylaria arbuscula]|nr:NAD(P)-binding protein [Xylaria arbuscula]
MSNTVVFITGTNRGIGKGMLERYLKLPNHIIIAANRSPDQPSSKELLTLPAADGTKVILVKLDATVWQDAFDAVKAIEGQGIDHIDIVIANAGVSYAWPTVRDAKFDDIETHMKVNNYGFISLFQATRSLLEKSKKQPILVAMSTNAGSLSSPLPFPNAAYGPSKLAAAWYTLKINMEEEWLNSFALGPGWVHTDLGDAGAAAFGVDKETQDKLMIGLEESCDGMMKVLSETSKEKHGGQLILWNGSPLAW